MLASSTLKHDWSGTSKQRNRSAPTQTAPSVSTEVQFCLQKWKNVHTRPKWTFKRFFFQCQPAKFKEMKRKQEANLCTTPSSALMTATWRALRQKLESYASSALLYQPHHDFHKCSTFLTWVHEEHLQHDMVTLGLTDSMYNETRLGQHLPATNTFDEERVTTIWTATCGRHVGSPEIHQLHLKRWNENSPPAQSEAEALARAGTLAKTFKHHRPEKTNVV